MCAALMPAVPVVFSTIKSGAIEPRITGRSEIPRSVRRVAIRSSSLAAYCDCVIAARSDSPCDQSTATMREVAPAAVRAACALAIICEYRFTGSAVRVRSQVPPPLT